MENKFIEKISTEEISKLPTCSFSGNIVVIDKAEDIVEACRDINGYSEIGFDTETRPTFKPGALNKVSLLQLSIPTKCYLFRLCKIPLDREILRILENKTINKIGADVKGDLRALNEIRKFKPGGFIDLQSEISQWGISDKSVRKMAGIVLGQRVSKAQRLSNWDAAKLTDAQQMYAATDAWICLEIWNLLKETDKNPLDIPAPQPKKSKKTHTNSKKE